MPQYNFRLRFHLPDRNHINADAEEVLVLKDRDGATIRLRSGAREAPIKDHSYASLLGGPYPNPVAARAAAERAKTALLLWAVRNRSGIDLGGRPPNSIITAAGLQWLEQQIGSPVRSDIHGIDVYEHVDGLVFAAPDADVRLCKDASAFVEQIASTLTTRVQFSAKQELAAEILSGSYFDSSDRSRFITLITAVEALLDPQLRPAASQELVQGLIDTVRGSGLDRSTRDAMLGNLQWLKRDSIGQAGRAMATRLLPGRTYHAQSPAHFFSFCYDLRSSILHNGAVPAKVVDFPSVCSTAREFVSDLLVASLEAEQD